MGDSNKFLSIDEQAISNRTVNLEEATSNLQKLQEHIFYPKSSRGYAVSSVNYPESSVTYLKSPSDYQKFSSDNPNLANHCSSPSTRSQTRSACHQLLNYPKCSVTMAAGEEVTLSSGKGIFYERQPSVTDEDLFGDGTKHQKDQIHSHMGTPENIINEENTDRVDGSNTTGTCDKDKLDVEVEGGIPNFGMLGISSSSDSGSSSSPKPFQVIQPPAEVKYKHLENESETIIGPNSVTDYSHGQDSDFKMRFLDGRSISADDKRKKYRNSSGGEVFDHLIESVEEEYQVWVHVRKSNSLPDLVTCSSQSPLSPPRYHSNPSQQCDVKENLEKQYEMKRMMEGTSTMPASKENPKIKRSVSIKEEPEYIPAAENSDESGNENNHSPESEEKPLTPTEERRRILSSGYVTGSSEAGSQDKSEVGTSRQISQNSQGSSGVWASQESVEKTDTVSDKNAASNKIVSAEFDQLAGMPQIDKQLLSTHSSGSNERQDVSPLSSGSGFNDSGSTGSSVNTILDAKTREAVRHSSGERLSEAKSQLQGEFTAQSSQDLGSGELPNLSIMDMGNRSKDISSSFGYLRIDEGTKEEEDVKSIDKKSAEPKQEQAPDSFQPHSYGNLPNLLESFSLKGSSLAKVQEEEDKNHMAVKKKYCGEGDDGSLVQGAQGSYTIYSRGLSLSTQASPPEAVKKLEEILMKLGDVLSPSILEKISQDIRGPDSITSPYNHDRDKTDTQGAQALKDVTLDDLERASRCNFPACRETCCLKMHEVLRVVKQEIPDIDPMFRLVDSYHRALYEHSESGCEETKCPVLFCSEFLEWETYQSKDYVKHLVKEIQKYFRNPTMKLFLQPSFKFHKLQRWMSKQEVKEFETHIPMFTVGKFGTAQVCMEKQSQKLVVLKMYPLMEYDHQLSLYTRLKDLDRPYIVPQLWMLEYDDKIQVCSLFAKGGSLEDYLNAVGVGPLPWSRVVRYMKQILSAVCDLHKRGVVYFNWNSGNMLFPDDRRYTIQVGNFSLSCPVGCQWDIGSVKECLPYNICPPELFDLNYKVDFKSDVWGAGCLFYEMLAGIPVLHHLRHEDRRTVHRQIQTVSAGFLPDYKSLSKEKRFILDSCWQIKMEDRQKIEDVLHYIKSLRVR